MRCIILVSVLLLGTDANRVHYRDFKLYRITPVNHKQLEELYALSDNPDYDFWSNGRGVGVSVDVMVPPRENAYFQNFIRECAMQYKVIIEDMEEIMEKERYAQQIASRASVREIAFTKYHRFDEIQAYLHNLQKNYPDIVKLYSAGKTVENRDLTAIKISSVGHEKKPAIFIDGGIHAREWIAPATVLYIVKELVQNKSNRHLLDGVEWHIMPLLNPDGYEYSHGPDRLWRKNRSPNQGSKCIGVDLNRNFGYHWGGPGTSHYPCDGDYKGARPFSELETKSLEKYFLSIGNNTKLYVTFHSYGPCILHPWAYTYELPEDAPELKRLGDLAATSIKSVFNTSYEVGSVTEIMYAAAGASSDWAKGEEKVKYSYTIELPGGGKHGFDLPTSEILRVVTETFEGVKAFHKDLIINA